MSHHKNADYEIVEKNSLYHNIKKSMQSQTTQIVMNLTFNDNVHSMTLEDILSLLKQQTIVKLVYQRLTEFLSKPGEGKVISNFPPLATLQPPGARTPRPRESASTRGRGVRAPNGLLFGPLLNP